MSKHISPSGILFAVALVMLIACGQNIDAGNIATAVTSGIGAFLCIVAACAKEPL